ncbi:GGDEF domain-containing protein [Ideonella sp. A 288]|uniref:GGDEF domain-containing protein n=1 Tax=Ideonella sp. A 288 TaxID=1962181 RepID=UPI000B4A7A97|nr:GGDEF domain-containing protein [Ideonella sp. A 288]
MIFSGVRWHGLKLSFGNWLTLISLLSLLPMLAFSVFVVQRMLASNEAGEIATLTRRTALAAEAIGRELDHARITARVIALSSVAVRGDFQGLHALASRVAASDPTIQVIALMQRDGQRVLSTAYPWGTPGTTQPLSANEARVIDEDVGVVSPIVPLGGDGGLVVGIAQPLQVEGGARYSLRIAILQPSLSAALASLRWPTDWTVAIIDQRMNIVARSRDEARRVGQAVTEDLQARIRGGHTEPFSAVNKDGMRTLAALARIPDSDWWVAAGLPEADLEARAREPLVWMSGIGLLLVTLGVVSASLLGRELTRQVRRAAHGEALGDLAVHELRHFEARTRHSAAALHDARHDALTGLPSRALFIEQADALNQNARTRPHWGLAALFIDLDGFKQANDRLGHDAGDRILVDVADALRQHTRAEDCAARLGGDEFVVALAAPSDHLQRISEGVAARIVRDVAALGDGLGCSIGVATAPAGVDLKALLERADRAMLSAKRDGKNRVGIAPERSD